MPGKPARWYFIDRFYLFLGLFLYYGLVFALSHIPGETIAHIGFNIWDKAAHFLLYMPLGALLGFTMMRSKSLASTTRYFLIGGMLLITLGALDEFHQSFVPGRFATVSDVIADLLGGGMGLFVAMLLVSARKKNG